MPGQRVENTAGRMNNVFTFEQVARALVILLLKLLRSSVVVDVVSVAGGWCCFGCFSILLWVKQLAL